MGCGAMMDQIIPTGYMGADAKSVPIKCGNTKIDGTEARCEACSTKRPWYVCKHGNDVSEWQCGQCEIESLPPEKPVLESSEWIQLYSALAEKMFTQKYPGIRLYIVDGNGETLNPKAEDNYLEIVDEVEDILSNYLEKGDD
tara:strand:- start:312 stop:737 length:426 start_codon:yes stop_codon:yes gene_type:complete